MLAGATISLEVAIVLISIQKLGFLPAIHGILLYIIGSQIWLLLYYFGYVYYDFYSTWQHTDIHDYVYPTMAMYCALFYTYAASVFIGIPPKKTKVSVSRRSVDTKILSGIVIFIWLQAIIQFLDLQKEVIFYNTSYLSMEVPDALINGGPFFQAIQKSSLLAGLVTFCVLGYCISKKYSIFVALILPIAVWHYAFHLSAHSRPAALFLIVCVVTMTMVQPKTFKALRLGLLSLAAITFLSVVYGRGTGENGFLTIGKFFENAVSAVNSRGMMNLVSNVFEGVFNFPESLQRGAYFSEAYKLLSFSPLPSAIDGFVQSDQNRLDLFVPMGAISEAWLFGAGYSILYLFICCVALRMATFELQKRQTEVASIANLLILFGLIIQFSYSLRTSIKLIYIGLALIVGIRAISWKRHERLQRRAVKVSTKWKPSGEA